MVSSSRGTTTKKAMERVRGTVKNVIFRKVKSGFVTIDSPFEFHQAILKFVPSIKSVYLPDTDVLNEPENIKQESKKIPETLKVHHVERFEVKGVYGLKVSYLAENEQPFYTQWYSNGKDLVICGHKIADVDDNHCDFVPWTVSAKKRSLDTVSGIVSAVVSQTVFLQLVYYLDYFY